LYADALSWVESLGLKFRENPAIEKGIAQIVFGMSDAEFRRECARITPALATWTRCLNRDIHRDVDWNLDVDPQSAWARWCGIAADN
jgi:hypothetical protein